MLPLQINLLQQTKVHNGVVLTLGFPYVVWQQLRRIRWNYRSGKWACCFLSTEFSVCVVDNQ